MGAEPLSRRSFLSAVSAGVAVTAAAPLLTACGGDGGSGSASKTIEWWDIATTEPQKSLFPQLVTAYQAEHPDVTIKLTNLENEAYKAKMTAVTASGKLPDIFMTWGGGVLEQQVQAGLVEDLTSRLGSFSAGLTPISQQAYQFGGKTYAVPLDIGMVGFWYNKRLFAKAGIKQPPATWAELLDAVRKLKAAGVTPIALAGKEKWPGHYYWAYLSLRVGGTAALKQAASTGDFTGPTFVEAGRHVKELVDLAPFQQGFQGAGYSTPGGQAATMGSGKAAMELMGQWGPSVQKDASGQDLGADLGFFPFPTVQGGQGLVSDIFGGGSGHALRTGAPDAALDFLKFLLRADNERKLIDSGVFLPVVKGAENLVTDPNRKIVAETVAKATGFQLFLDQAFPPAVGQEVNDSVADLIAGEKTPEQVAQSVTATAKNQ